MAEEESQAEDTRAFLDDLVRLARVHGAETIVGTGGSSMNFIDEAPYDDVSISGLAERPDLNTLRDIVELTGSSDLFVRDSGTESALA